GRGRGRARRWRLASAGLTGLRGDRLRGEGSATRAGAGAVRRRSNLRRDPASSRRSTYGRPRTHGCPREDVPATGPRRPLQPAEIKRAVGEVEGFNAKVAVQSSRPTRALARSSPTPRRFSIAWTPTPRAVSETRSTRFRARDGRR